jgi:uncharacterized membrane protein (UPF0127 family)
MRRLGDDAGPSVYVAESRRARLLGLAGLSEAPHQSALLIANCSTVHTFGMRFHIDVLFLDEHCEVIGERRHLGPGRMVCQRGARAVLEFPSGS